MMSVRRVNLGTCVVLRHDVVTMVLVHRCRIDCSHRHAESLRRASRVWCEYDGRSSYSVRLHQTRKQTSAMTIDTGVRSYSNATASSCAYRRPLSLKQARCKWLMEGKPAPDMERPYSVTQPAITPPTLHPVTLRHEVMTDNEKMHILRNTVTVRQGQNMTFPCRTSFESLECVLMQRCRLVRSLSRHCFQRY